MRIKGASSARATAAAAANRPYEHAALQENENVLTNCSQAFVAGLALAMTQKQEVARCTAKFTHKLESLAGTHA